MSTSLQRTHLGYTILAKPRQVHLGRYLAGFEIVRFNQADPRHVQPIYEVHGTVAHTFATEDEAVERAHTDARHWIDARQD